MDLTRSLNRWGYLALSDCVLDRVEEAELRAQGLDTDDEKLFMVDSTFAMDDDKWFGLGMGKC